MVDNISKMRDFLSKMPMKGAKGVKTKVKGLVKPKMKVKLKAASGY